MCGIIGIVTHGSQTCELTEADVGRLRHRGPDASGLYHEDCMSFGHARLSILDLSSLGQQPMRDSSGRYTLVFNGEIYNYIELKQELLQLGYSFTSESDSEVLLTAYAKWGKNCVARFRGMFAFAIWDSIEQKIFAARDRCGEKPFIYYLDGTTFYFASELKALLPLLPHKPKLNSSVVDLYLHYQYVPEPFTLLEGIHKLPAAHVLEIDVSTWKLEMERYWSLEHMPERQGPPQECILKELETAVTLCLRSDVPVGVALSGGIDSGAIAALAARHYDGPMHAFSVGYPGCPPYDERKQARELAEKLGMIFHEVEIPIDSFVDFFPELVWILDEPVADPAAFGHYAVPKAAADLGIKVLLTGIGGDEVFWGYEWVRRAVTVNEARMRESASFRSMRSLVVKLLPDALRHRLAFSKKVPSAIRDYFACILPQVGITPPEQLEFLAPTPDFHDAFTLKRLCYGCAMAGIDDSNAFVPTNGMPERTEDIPASLMRLLFETWLVSNCLNLSDRVSMAVGVESRLPFLDKGLIELAMGLRVGNPDFMLQHKAWLRQALVGILPEDVLARPKRGFQPPVHEWLGGVIARYGDKLLQGHLVAAGILDSHCVATLIEEWPHQGWPRLFFTYKLVLLECWYASLVLGEGP